MTNLRWLEHSAQLRVGSMATLLIVLVLSIFVAPVVLAPDTIMGQVVEDVLISLILLCGALAVSDRRAAFVPLAVVAIVVIAVRWTSWFLPTGLSPALRAEAIFFAFSLLGLVIAVKVFGAGTAVRDRIWGAIVLYMLLGVVWAVAYEIVNIYVRGAYTGIGPDDAGNRWSWVYFSFTTLTTVGYGDITPIARVARSMANMEALIGQLYPAIVLGRLVSLPTAEAEASARE
jgi:hypothetical protein